MTDSCTDTYAHLVGCLPPVFKASLEILRQNGRLPTSNVFLSDRSPLFSAPLSVVGPPDSSTHQMFRAMMVECSAVAVGVWFEASCTANENKDGVTAGQPYRTIVVIIGARNIEPGRHEQIVMLHAFSMLDERNPQEWIPVHQGLLDPTNTAQNLIEPLLPPWRPDASLANVLTQ